MGIMTEIKDLLKEIPISDILREKLASADKSISKLEKENAELRKINLENSKKIQWFENELNSLRMIRDEFVESNGALFKRKQGGGYHSVPYCPECKKPLSLFGRDFQCACDNCKINFGFYQTDLIQIIKDLPA